MEDRPFAIRATTASLPSATVFVRAGSSQAVTSGRGINACMDGQPLPAIPLHGLHHSYATLALASGVNPRIVSGRLGHSTVALTLDVYSHVLPQADRQAAEAIADLLL